MFTALSILVFFAAFSAALGAAGRRGRNPILERSSRQKAPGRAAAGGGLAAFWGAAGEGAALDPGRAALVGAAAGLFGFGLFGIALGDALAGAAAGLLAFMLAPRLAAGAAARAKVRRFKESLEFGAEVLIAGLAAGMSFPDALKEAARTSPEPVRSEFERAWREIAHNRPATEAFAALAKRVPCQEAEELRDAVELYHRVGGPRAMELLRAVVANLREGASARFQVNQHVRGAKTSAVIVGLMPVGYLAVMWLIAPDLFEPLFATQAGKNVLAGCIALFGFGVWLMWSILRGIEEF